MLFGVLLFILGVGTAGPFTITWIGVGALLSLIAVISAAARTPLDQPTTQRAITALSATGALGALAWLGMLISLVIVLTSTPSAGPGGPNGQPGRPGGQAAPTATAPGGQAAPATAEPAAGQGRPGGQQEPGGQPGPAGQFGPGGGSQGSTTPLLIGVVLMTLFTGTELVSVVRARRAVREPGALPQAVPVDYRRELGQVAFSCIAITIVWLAAAQLVPVTRDNPPAQVAVQWDSPQTETLARRACMDCHSNETRWPWYASVAPGSWLLRSHVSNARAEFNLSALNTVPEFRRARLPDDAAMQIRTGDMPPKDYLFLHPDARLTDAEKAQLMERMRQSLANSLPR